MAASPAPRKIPLMRKQHDYEVTDKHNAGIVGTHGYYALACTHELEHIAGKENTDDADDYGNTKTE